MLDAGNVIAEHVLGFFLGDAEGVQISSVADTVSPGCAEVRLGTKALVNLQILDYVVQLLSSPRLRSSSVHWPNAGPFRGLVQTSVFRPTAAAARPARSLSGIRRACRCRSLFRAAKGRFGNIVTVGLFQRLDLFDKAALLHGATFPRAPLGGL